MLKMFKYELLHSYRTYFIVFAIFLIGCAIVPLLPTAGQVVGASVITMTIFGIVIALIVSIFVSFNNSMFKEPGYLTQTLPLTTNQILWGKILATILWLFIASAVLALGIFIMGLVFSMLNSSITLSGFLNLLKEGLNILVYEIQKDILGFLFSLLLVLIQAVSSIISLYALITVLQTKLTRKRKALFGCAIVIVYIIAISIYLNPFLIRTFDVASYVDGELIFNAIASMIQGTLLYILMYYVLERKLEM